jgi:lipopolysaccharide/colanic/teichoic acid biosynthesis glycosyltransferase
MFYFVKGKCARAKATARMIKILFENRREARFWGVCGFVAHAPKSELLSTEGYNQKVMSKQQAGMSDVSSDGGRARLSWSTALAGGMAVCLAGGFWLLTAKISRQPDWTILALASILPLIIAVAVEHALEAAPVSEARRYRLAFAMPALMALLTWLSLWISPKPNLPLALLAVELLAAFLGGLIATAKKRRLWENNSPPSEAVRLEVYQRHLAMIGKGDPTPIAKRAFDVLLSTGGLVISAPVWTLVAFWIWLEDPGPVLFVKNSVGKGGKNFLQFKFRSMVQGAEENTGPVLAAESDERVLLAGKFLRKTALDEIPQLVNILRGEMSFVGPRPQRTVLVGAYLEVLPEYAERHRVLPGLAGLAQVAGDYYLTPRQKLRFDRLYIQQAGLGFDIKLLALSFLIAFWYRWQPGWNGRLPRGLLRLGS